MTLGCYFLLKRVFCTGLTGFFRLALGDNYVETNKILIYYESQKCSTVSSNVRLMRNYTGGGQKRRFSVLSVAISLEPLNIRPKLSYKLTTEIFSTDSTFYRCTITIIIIIISTVVVVVVGVLPRMFRQVKVAAAWRDRSSLAA